MRPTTKPLAELDSAIVFAPAGPVVPAALRAVGPGGTVALAGIYMTPVPEMDYESCLFHEKNLRSVEANTRADGEALLTRGGRDPDPARGQQLPGWTRPTMFCFAVAEDSCRRDCAAECCA